MPCMTFSGRKPFERSMSSTTCTPTHSNPPILSHLFPCRASCMFPSHVAARDFGENYKNSTHDDPGHRFPLDRVAVRGKIWCLPSPWLTHLTRPSERGCGGICSGTSPGCSSSNVLWIPRTYIHHHSCCNNTCLQCNHAHMVHAKNPCASSRKLT